jgi:tripartite-type tricarboxylate transporter receptor subunit TctC
MSRLFVGMVAAVALAHGHGALAAAYPDRTIRIVVPVAPGGITDILARLFGGRLSERVGQPVVIDNRPGAGLTVGMAVTAKAPPDGYTIVLTSQGTASVLPVLKKDLPYDTLRDFAPVSHVVNFPVVLVANPDFEAKSFKAFVELARSKPGRLTYGTPGNATVSHLAMELLKHQGRFDVTHIAYKGESPALIDVMGGRVSVTFLSVAVALPAIKSGKVIALAVATKDRMKFAPEVPSIAESGFREFHDFDVSGWFGFLAPAGTPPAVKRRLSDEFQAILKEPGVRNRLADMGVEPVGSSPDEFRKWIQSEMDRWRKVVTEAGIKVE